jgi:hypothetical protein
LAATAALLSVGLSCLDIGSAHGAPLVTDQAAAAGADAEATPTGATDPAPSDPTTTTTSDPTTTTTSVPDSSTTTSVPSTSGSPSTTVPASTTTSTTAGVLPPGGVISLPGPWATTAQQPPVPSQGAAYLGAWLNPTRAARPNEAELAALSGFNQQLGHPLSILHVYEPWDQPVNNTLLRQFLASGSIPMLDWACGTADSQIVSGADDKFIAGYARQLASLNAPLFLRWYWEPNFPGSANYIRCMGDLGPAGYREAFQHIYDIFQQEGATNVAFVWCVATSGKSNFEAYFPGSQYVDWIAADGYDRSTSVVQNGSDLFVKRFSAWYNKFSHYRKPMMITETAAVNNPGVQPAYLQQILADLPRYFPLIRGVLYFDTTNQRFSYGLTADGMSALAALAANPLFRPGLRASSIAVRPPTGPIYADGRQTVTAALSQPQALGEVTFEADGTPAASCTEILGGPTASCQLPYLAPGHHSLVALYGGSALYGAAKSEPVTITVLPGSPPSPQSLTPLIPSAFDAGVMAPWAAKIGDLTYQQYRSDAAIGAGISTTGVPVGADQLAGAGNPNLFGLAASKHSTGSMLGPFKLWSAVGLVPAGLLIVYIFTSLRRDRRKRRIGASGPGLSTK